MFDQYLIRKDSLKNDYKDGEAVGFQFAVRIADYRGCFLSLHNGYYISCDGTEYPRELQTFEINGCQKIVLTAMLVRRFLPLLLKKEQILHSAVVIRAYFPVSITRASPTAALPEAKSSSFSFLSSAPVMRPS